MVVKDMKVKKPKTIGKAIMVAKRLIKKKKIRNVTIPKIIPVRGGFLQFLIPILSSLGALGAVSSGVSNVVSAINRAKMAKAELDEAKRHNSAMESQIGKGLYLTPYKKGLGLRVAKN